MERVIGVVFLLSLSLFTSAQEQSYTFTEKRKGPIQLITESDTIRFDPYEKGKGNTRRRLATVNGTTYTLSVYMNRARVQSILDSEGVTKATRFLGSRKNRYDLLLPDGKVLDYRFEGNKWFYSRDGKDILSGRLKTEKRQKKIIIDILEPSLVTPELLLASLERGTKKIASHRNRILWVVPVATVVLIEILIPGPSFFLLLLHARPHDDH
jgi:hypothetical protein